MVAALGARQGMLLKVLDPVLAQVAHYGAPLHAFSAPHAISHHFNQLAEQRN